MLPSMISTSPAYRKMVKRIFCRSLKCGFPHRRLRLTRSSKKLDMPTRPPNYGEILQSTVRQRRRHYHFPNWKVSVDSACGSPAWELVAKADEWKPDLIVVGSHGRTALGRFVLGSVSQRVLTEALCSVRIARGRVDEPGLPVRIIVGTDGSPASDEALRSVAARCWPPQSEVKVVMVDDPLTSEFLGKVIPPLGKMLEEDRQQERAWVEKISKQSLDLLRGAGIKVSCVLREGDPKQELCKAAEEWNADCIFVGSAGFSNRFERFVLGSISAAVAARAHCSVEVVRKSVRQTK